MDIVFYYAGVILFGYLVGSSNMALYLSKLKGVDIRDSGSRNLGASNAMILLGWKAGILVGIHDIGKAALAVYLATYFFPDLPHIGAVAGVASVMGHMFPFYLRFRGGKGFASYLGMTLALNWKFALMVMVMVVIVTLLTDYIVIGTVSTMVVVPTYLGISTDSWIFAGILCIASCVILYKHRENYIRIYRGTELGFRRTSRGKERMPSR